MRQPRKRFKLLSPVEAVVAAHPQSTEHPEHCVCGALDWRAHLAKEMYKVAGVIALEAAAEEFDRLSDEVIAQHRKGAVKCARKGCVTRFEERNRDTECTSRSGHFFRATDLEEAAASRPDDWQGSCEGDDLRRMAKELANG